MGDGQEVWEAAGRGREEERVGLSPGLGAMVLLASLEGDDWVMRHRRFRASSGTRSPPFLPCILATLPPSLGGPRLVFHQVCSAFRRQQCQLLPWAAR